MGRSRQTAGRWLRSLGSGFRRQSIRTRILVIALVPSLLTAGLLTMQMFRQTLAEVEHNTRTELLSATRHMAAAAQYALISGNADLLLQTAEEERRRENLQFACIQYLAGAMRYCAGMPDDESLPSPPAVGTVVEIAGAWLAAHPVSLPQNEMIDDLTAGGPGDPKIIGYAIAALSLQPLRDSQRKALLAAASLIFSSALLTALLAWRMSNRPARRIQHVSQVVDRIAGGDLLIRVDANPSTELGVLEKGINRMA